MSKSLIALASDHRGFQLKTQFLAWLATHDYQPLDLGTNSVERCDAMDFASRMAIEFKSNDIQFGILICGSGQAMAMTANRYAHLRAALCTHSTMARLAREHNDANVLVLGADIVGPAVAQECLEVFLATPFLAERYAERRDRFMKLGGL